jgi:hypothetical protein
MFQLKRSYPGFLVVVGVCAALLVPAATAVAQDALSNPSAAQYTPNSQVQGTDTNGSNSGPAAANTAEAANTSAAGAGSTLPFTGMDLAVVASIALVMIAVGMGLRKLSEPRT